MKKLILAAAFGFGVAAAQAETGIAKMKATAENSAITGTVAFSDTKDGLKMSVQLAGVPAGDHGFHIHEFGGCEDMGKSAGGHYNPFKAPHGYAVKNGIKKAHAGDLGNITADAEGKAMMEVVLPKTCLAGCKNTVGGRAVILHEKIDDFTQPLGNAGGRIACGIITISAP